jgi:hypothetical protein
VRPRAVLVLLAVFGVAGLVLETALAAGLAFVFTLVATASGHAF